MDRRRFIRTTTGLLALTAMLHLGDPPALAERVPVDPFTVRMAGGREPLDAFLGAARRFAADSGFMEWYHDRRPAHVSMVRGARSLIERDLIPDLADYYGERRRAYTLVLAPLAHPGGFGPRERHLPRLRPPVSRLQADIREEVEAHVPWDVHVADWVSEHVVRGVTTRLAFRELGREAGEAALRRELRSFPHVAEVAERLESYERRRDRYPTLGDFFPRLVALFEGLA